MKFRCGTGGGPLALVASSGRGPEGGSYVIGLAMYDSGRAGKPFAGGGGPTLGAYCVREEPGEPRRDDGEVCLCASG